MKVTQPTLRACVTFRHVAEVSIVPKKYAMKDWSSGVEAPRFNY
jgi:hypothetical protein